VKIRYTATSALATGGTITIDSANGNVYHTFTTSGNFIPNF
jgi:phosphohistidine swiveling domain-containing protein